MILACASQARCRNGGVKHNHHCFKSHHHRHLNHQNQTSGPVQQRQCEVPTSSHAKHCSQQEGEGRRARTRGGGWSTISPQIFPTGVSISPLCRHATQRTTPTQYPYRRPRTQGTVLESASPSPGTLTPPLQLLSRPEPHLCVSSLTNQTPTLRTVHR